MNKKLSILFGLLLLTAFIGIMPEAEAIPAGGMANFAGQMCKISDTMGCIVVQGVSTCSLNYSPAVTIPTSLCGGDASCALCISFVHSLTR